MKVYVKNEDDWWIHEESFDLGHKIGFFNGVLAGVISLAILLAIVGVI
jgi:hypothetical protein